MHIQIIKRVVNGKTYRAKLLRESYRENGKVKKRTIASLTKVPDNIVEMLNQLLKGKNIKELSDIKLLKQYQGKSYGAIKVIYETLKRLGIVKILGRDKKTKDMILLMICGIILSRNKSKNYISNYWSKTQSIEEVLKIKDYFKEDYLYSSLEWLGNHQSKIEKQLWDKKDSKEKNNHLFLYDITSSYVEGKQIALTNYGYNRDKKRGKKQIVIGLLTDNKGDPISIEVFEGNTLDYKTVSGQLKKIKEVFGVKEVVYVGDRGMLKSKQIEEINSRNWQYITGITKPQIEKLIKKGIIEYGLFDKALCEVEHEGIRYILKRNPFRAKEIENNLKSKIEYLKQKVNEKNKYLLEKKKSSVEIGLKNIEKYVEKLRLTNIINLKFQGRRIELSVNKEEMDKYLKLSGCYVLKTNISSKILKKEEVHSHYKELANIERDFRTLKTGFLEIRPIFVRKESHVRGHVFACMLALKVIRYVERETKELNIPIDYIWDILDNVKYVINEFKGETFKNLPEVKNDSVKKILKVLKITFPKSL